MTELEKQGKALRNIRKSKTSFNIEQVASKLGRTKVWLSEIERGKKNIYFSDAKALCKIYGIKVSELGEEIDRLGGNNNEKV